MKGLDNLRAVSHSRSRHAQTAIQSPKRTMTLTAESAFQDSVKTTIESLRPKTRAVSVFRAARHVTDHSAMTALTKTLDNLSTKERILYMLQEK